MFHQTRDKSRILLSLYELFHSTFFSTYENVDIINSGTFKQVLLLMVVNHVNLSFIQWNFTLCKILDVKIALFLD